MNVNDQMVVSLLVQEHGGVRRVREPVSVGLPFSRGQVFNIDHLTLWDSSGLQHRLQSHPLAQWNDGSLKWALLDFQADVEAKSCAVYHVRANAGLITEFETPSISFQEEAEQLVVETGKAKFFIDRQIFKPFDRVVLGGADLIAPEGSALTLTDELGHRFYPRIGDFAIESRGPLRLTIRASGHMESSGCKNYARFMVRLSFFAGSGLTQMLVTLHNPRAARHLGGLWDLGDEGSIYFKDFALSVPSYGETARQVAWTPNPSLPMKHYGGDKFEIYQDSSGGENWRSTNHVNRFGEVPHQFRGYRVTDNGSLVHEGLRSTPIVEVHGSQGWIAATVDKFWQNFPKAIETHGSILDLGIFPHQFSDVFELQGGEQKTHTIYLEFHAPGDESQVLGWVHDRLLPRATPEYYAATKAVSYLSPASQDSNVECQELIDVAISGSLSFAARREIIDEYGWRHFGDVYADHEAVGHTGESPLVAHYNNQYDVIYGALVQYLRSADRRWFQLMADLARHVIDIDIYHTEEDRPAYNGGLFWHTDHYLDAGMGTHRTYSRVNSNVKVQSSYGGGPSNEHNYTSGLLHYYYLTGDEMARLAALSLADWVISMDGGSRRRLGFMDSRPTGLASATSSRDYHGPGRGAGNSINALLDAHMLTRNQAYLDNAETLIRRCIHPHDDIVSRNLDDPEHRWSYLVFLQVLGKYLSHKIEISEFDSMYGYARASLLHYANWMVEHEAPYSTLLHKVEIPTETWPAQDIRKSVVFHLASIHATGAKREMFRQKASEFFHTCVSDVRAYASCTLVRPLVLLMTNTYVHSFFEINYEEKAPAIIQQEFGCPEKFSPQFRQLYWLAERADRAVRAVRRR